jgi:MFS family permease
MATIAPKTWKPTTAGILSIVAGALNGLMAIGIIVAIIFVGSLSPMIMDYIPPEDAPFIMPLVVPMLIVILVFSVAATVFPIIGGVYALRRRGWEWALAGSIIAIFRTFILGLLATIFVAMAKDEFE